jgi:hypothetical protein
MDESKRIRRLKENLIKELSFFPNDKETLNELKGKGLNDNKSFSAWHLSLAEPTCDENKYQSRPVQPLKVWVSAIGTFLPIATDRFGSFCRSCPRIVLVNTMTGQVECNGSASPCNYPVGSTFIDTADKTARFVSQQTPNLSLRKEALHGLSRKRLLARPVRQHHPC